MVNKFVDKRPRVYLCGPVPENNLPSEISFLYFRLKIIIDMVLHRLIGVISPETRCCKGF